jgi:eukaryotic-like serine/threonine-protein kinase
MPLVDSAAKATIQYAPSWEARPRSWSMPEPAVPSMSLRPGSIVAARYMLLERIGWGGSATVYRADDLALEGRIALKVLHRALADDCVVTERFRREASSAGSLRHERIVRVHEYGVSTDGHYIAMEYVAGRSLKAIINRDGPLAPSRAVDLTIQILDAAGFAHDHGIIHRDLKPQNVIVGPRDQVKVTDFGIAVAGRSDLTPAGSILGTIDYVSPEQVIGQPATKASDLYSVGIILYELLTGRLPFEAELPIAVALKHVNASPASPRHFNDAISPELEAIVLRTLDKSPTKRFPDARALTMALQHASTVERAQPRLCECCPCTSRRGRPDLAAANRYLAEIDGAPRAMLRPLFGPLVAEGAVSEAR